MPTMRLRRRLTAFNVWSFALGGIIGWGSMVMPGTTFLKRGGTVGTMAAMEIAAVIMLIIAYNYAYMITKFPETGGQFIFAEKTFGRTHGFICAWFLGLCYIMIIPMNATALCLVFRALSERSVFHFGFHYTVAGYDIYSGEVILALLALFFFAFVSSRGVHVAGRLQSLFVVLLLTGVIVIMAAAFLSPNADRSHLQPMFFPDGPEHGSALVQVISILVLAPWMFVGFDTVPQMAEESLFPPSRAKFIMDTSIIAGCFVYVAMTLTGVSGIATFAAAYNFLGSTGIFIISVTALMAGIFIISVTALMAMLTGILGFYTATSRLLYSLSRDGMLPEWFGRLNPHGVPFNAILFCALVSLPAPFVGRNALGWTVDMSSIGGAISFGYTSLAALHFARIERRKDIIIFGTIGLIFSILFAFFLLVPVRGLDCSLEFPSYILLLVWTVAGILLFLRTKRA